MGFKTGSFTSVGNRGLNPTISLSRTRRVENPLWNFTLPSTFQGTVAGYTSGGSTTPSPPTAFNIIDKFPFATNANATDVGDLTVARYGVSGQSSNVSGYSSGGEYPLGVSNFIDKFPFASNANATDVGDLTVARKEAAGQSSDVSGYTSGGLVSPGRTNVIDKFPFASNANATDVGDLTVERYLAAGQSSTVSGYVSGGSQPQPPPPYISNIIDKFPFATNANATDVGDLTVGRYQAAGQSSDVSGYTSGGRDASFRNIIDKFPFATNANATDVGDLITTLVDATGQSSTASGYSSGGYCGADAPVSYVTVNVIQKFPFATNANATDVGDLTQARRQSAGQQD